MHVPVQDLHPPQVAVQFPEHPPSHLLKQDDPQAVEQDEPQEFLQPDKHAPEHKPLHPTQALSHPEHPDLHPVVHPEPHVPEHPDLHPPEHPDPHPLHPEQPEQPDAQFPLHADEHPEHPEHPEHDDPHVPTHNPVQAPRQDDAEPVIDSFSKVSKKDTVSS